MRQENDTDEEQPLDPAMERVRRKMVRLMVVSIGIMMVGLMAVLGAIVYKLGNSGEQDAVSGTESRVLANQAELALPDGARILSASLEGERMLVDVQRLDGAREFIVLDINTGEVLSRLVIK